MKRFGVGGVVFLAGLLMGTGRVNAQMGAPGVAPVTMPAVPGPLAAKYKADADRILQAAMADDEGYADLTYLCDHIGKRLSGSPQLNTAVQWGAELMRKAGLQNVQVQPVMVPHWVRGSESAALVGPSNQIVKPLHMLGLGMSVERACGITAPVVFVHTFAELDAMPDAQVKGKIVVFNPGGTGMAWGRSTGREGPSRAAAKGAAAVLVRSATGLAMQTPHTGTLLYDASKPKVPAAAISVEDALLIERLSKEGPVNVHLQMDAHMEADVQAGNVMGEIVGSEHPEQVVVLGGHIDSWDVGQGAQDDGNGIMATFEAVSLLRKLGLKPKRTVRVVFWVNEENGGAGGKAYRKMIGDKIADQVAAIEMDEGAEKPLGMSYGGFGGGGRRGAAGAPPAPVMQTAVAPEMKQSMDVMRDVVSLLGSIGADTLAPGGGGSDIGPITADGVPALSPNTVGEHYFDWHHTEADTLDKVDPVEFKKNTGMLAVVAYVLADMDGRLVGRKSAGE